MLTVISTIENNIKTFSTEKSPYTNVVGVSRSLIALGTLLTLLTNSINTIFVRKISDVYVIPLMQDEFSSKINFFFLFGNENTVFMKWFAIASLILVISGYYQKISSLLHWWISFSFLHSSTIIDGGDQIASILTLLLIPICFFDNRKNHWDSKKTENRMTNLISICFLYIIRIQVAIIYLHASIGKFSHIEWADGTALYYWLNQSFFGLPSYLTFLNYFLENHLFVTILTYGVLIFELMLFLGLFATIRYRKKILLAGLLFHFSIILFHGIFSFFFSISAALILYLYPTYENLDIKHFVYKLQVFSKKLIFSLKTRPKISKLF